MAAIDRMTIEIGATVGVKEEAVDRCLRILEWYLDDHPDKWLMAETTTADDKTRLRIVYK